MSSLRSVAARSVGLSTSLALLVACGSEGQVAPAATSASVGGGGAGGDGAGGGRNCWEEGASEWSIAPLDVSGLAGEGFRDPMLTPDGLTLYYIARANLTAPQRVYRASRASRALPFTGGESLGSWSGFDPVAHPWVAKNQLFLNFDSGFGDFEIAVSF